MKVCIEDGCWQPTPDTRCPEHQREFRRPKDRKYGRGHRAQAVGPVCVCCGATEDLCRDHDGAGYQTMCRSCNGSKGGNVMADQRCPKHGGTVV